MGISKKRCNIIIDSCCDLPKSVVDTLDVDLLQFPFASDDGEHSDDLGVSMPAHEFFDRMRKGEQPTTMQIPANVFEEHFKDALESGVPTVYLSFSSGLSGSYDTACLVAENLKSEYPDGELHVVDTKLASIAEGLIVLEACHQRERGLSAEELAAWVLEARNFVHGFFTLDNFEALRRGGRIPDIAAYAGTKLDIKPILTFDIDGALSLFSVTRGRKKSLRALGDVYANRPPEAGKTPVIVASADAPHDADNLEGRVTKQTPGVLVIRTSIGPVIGSHVGPGMVAVSFFGPDRRKSIPITDRIAKRVSSSDSGLGAVLNGDGDE
jgi:DegV family protein with EDD domain